jgi:hypothetical protein
MTPTTDRRDLFEFYTYDAAGRDRMIPIRADSEEEAWQVFRAVYGQAAYVDQVIRA